MLSSCQTADLGGYWRAAQCGIESCKYQKADVDVFVEDRNVYDPKDAFSIILNRTMNHPVCLAGLILVENRVAQRQEILLVNKEVNADYVLNINVETDKVYNFRRGDYQLLGLVEPYQYSLIVFFVKSERAVKCYDPFELLEA